MSQIFFQIRAQFATGNEFDLDLDDVAGRVAIQRAGIGSVTETGRGNDAIGQYACSQAGTGDLAAVPVPASPGSVRGPPAMTLSSL